MPVGIPKVPFLVPGDEDASWTDLYNRIYHQRLLFLGQRIDSETSNQLVGLMVYLSMEDKTRDLYMFINSPGGGIIPGMAIFDGMHFVEAEVQTVCVGVAASMASLILVGGESTKRLAFPHSRVMIHQPACDLIDDTIGLCVLEVGEIRIMYDMIIQIYVQRTGKPAWRIWEDMQRDTFMSAEEARAYGIVDMVSE